MERGASVWCDEMGLGGENGGKVGGREVGREETCLVDYHHGLELPFNRLAQHKLGLPK